ncbi:MAG: GTP cyclohydrolase II [Actinomycetota bacterium]|nr:GTP cyclohydrolase II [Actinomycetota bacterium]
MAPTEVARVQLPTAFGTFDLRAFKTPAGFVHLALVAGDIGDGASVLTRVHSECLTGDALGSLRCDCGVQLAAAMRAIRAEGRGVLLYVTGHEGRGIGLIDKLRAYLEQDRGADTIDANLHLGLPVDNRDYGEAADVLGQIGVRTVRLITNNPRKITGLTDAGIEVESVRAIPVAANDRTVSYLQTKRDRLGHGSPLGPPLQELSVVPDVASLIGRVRPKARRPYVAIKYAQSMDGRIATATGDSRWISSQEERAMSHAMRARCDGIMVGVGTVLNDDPQLTVRLVPGPSPTRVVLDSKLQSPLTSRVFDGDAPTVVITTERSASEQREEVRSRDVAVHLVAAGPGGVDIRAALALLSNLGMSSLLVEGGQRVITSLLRARCGDRVIVALAPIVLGTGIDGVGDLDTERVRDGLSLTDRYVTLAGSDVIVASDVVYPGADSDADGSGRDDGLTWQWRDAIGRTLPSRRT